MIEYRLITMSGYGIGKGITWYTCLLKQDISASTGSSSLAKHSDMGLGKEFTSLNQVVKWFVLYSFELKKALLGPKHLASVNKSTMCLCSEILPCPKVDDTVSSLSHTTKDAHTHTQQTLSSTHHSPKTHLQRRQIEKVWHTCSKVHNLFSTPHKHATSHNTPTCYSWQ